MLTSAKADPDTIVIAHAVTSIPITFPNPVPIPTTVRIAMLMNLSIMFYFLCAQSFAAVAVALADTPESRSMTDDDLADNKLPNISMTLNATTSTTPKPGNSLPTLLSSQHWSTSY